METQIKGTAKMLLSTHLLHFSLFIIKVYGQTSALISQRFSHAGLSRKHRPHVPLDYPGNETCPLPDNPLRLAA